VDNDTGKTIVKVTDQATGQLIRQIPSQEVMELAKSINQLQGILFNKKV
jgi:flagellar protein FlaG